MHVISCGLFLSFWIFSFTLASISFVHAFPLTSVSLQFFTYHTIYTKVRITSSETNIAMEDTLPAFVQHFIFPLLPILNMRPRDDCQCVWDDAEGFRRRKEEVLCQGISLYGKCLDGMGRFVYISDSIVYKTDSLLWGLDSSYN